MTGTTSSAVDQNTIRRRGTGLIAYNPEKTFPGYTLFAPLTGQGEVYLINLEGEVVHKWKLPYRPGMSGYLLPNGNLFYAGKTPEISSKFPSWLISKGGVVMEVDSRGKIVWEYYNPAHHHDAQRLRNGNTILLCIEKIPRTLLKRIKGGVPGTEIDGDMYADVIHEVTPNGEIVWTWHAWEYLDPKTDIISLQYPRDQWSGGTAVSELSDGKLLVSLRAISTIVIVDRKTGDIVWKLGDNILAQPHSPTELPNENLLIFDNGGHRRNTSQTFSRVIEVERKTKEIVWEYKDKPCSFFFSSHISGAQRLLNGNTLITEGITGRLFEVTAAGEVVWEYIVPYFAPLEDIAGELSELSGEANRVFRAFRYSPQEIPWL